MLIAIDGPSGSGKSTTARRVAQRLGLAYLDTGAMYRAVTVVQLRSGVSNEDAESIGRVAETADLRIDTDPLGPRFWVNGTEVTSEIRAPEVSANVSAAATNLDVRSALTERMREIITKSDRRIVVEGRDITTVVAPDADLRILLLADPGARLARRGAELGGKVSEEELADQVLRRDREDSTVSEFFKAAPGVTVIDSTELSLDEVVSKICELAGSND